MRTRDVVALIGFLAFITGLAALAPANTDAKYYFGAIGLVVVLGVIALLSVLAWKTDEGAQKLYFGVIGTLVGSVIGLTGGIAGGAAGGTNAGQAAAQNVAQDQTQVATRAADVTAQKVRKTVKADVTTAVKQAVR
jgi:hypothetical protein